jgi:hypothetical protein
MVGLLMLDVTRNTGRNMDRFGVVPGGGGRRPLELATC